MQYKIIVDKHPSTNPTTNKKEYIIDIEELRIKGNVYDSLIITKDEDYVIRRLELTKYHVLNVLENPIKQPIADLNIELFEGDNYIYLMDMSGNKFYAEYLIKNDFTDLYVMRSEMNSAINQTAKQIELSVNQKLIGYSTTEEINTMLQVNNGNILASVQGTYATKTELGNTQKTLSASMELKLNKKDLVSELNATADIIRMKAGTFIFTGNNFSIDANGNITATGGKIGGFTLGANKFSTSINGIYNYNIYDYRNTLGSMFRFIDLSSLYNIYDINSDGFIDTGDTFLLKKYISGVETNNKKIAGILEINTDNVKDCITVKQGSNLIVSIGVGGINTSLLSAENIICSSKKNTNDNFSGVAINGSESSPRITITDGYETNTSQIEATSISAPKFFTTEGNDVLSTEILYDNASGTNGTVSLSENANKFSYIEIFYADSSVNNSYSSVKVQSPNGKSVLTPIILKADDASMRINTRKVTISGTSITVNNYQVIYSPGTTAYNNNEQKIYKVIGFK